MIPFGRVTFVPLAPLAIVAATILCFIGIYLGEHGMNFGDWQAIVPPVLVRFLVGGSLMRRRAHDLGLPTA